MPHTLSEMGGGGSNNKKDHAAGKKQRCPLSFFRFFFVFSPPPPPPPPLKYTLCLLKYSSVFYHHRLCKPPVFHQQLNIFVISYLKFIYFPQVKFGKMPQAVKNYITAIYCASFPLGGCIGSAISGRFLS